MALDERQLSVRVKKKKASLSRFSEHGFQLLQCLIDVLSSCLPSHRYSQSLPSNTLWHATRDQDMRGSGAKKKNIYIYITQNDKMVSALENSDNLM